MAGVACPGGPQEVVQPVPGVGGLAYVQDAPGVGLQPPREPADIEIDAVDRRDLPSYLRGAVDVRPVLERPLGGSPEGGYLPCRPGEPLPPEGDFPVQRRCLAERADVLLHAGGQCGKEVILPDLLVAEVDARCDVVPEEGGYSRGPMAVVEQRAALGEAHGAVPGGAQEVVEPLLEVVAIADVQDALAVLARKPGDAWGPEVDAVDGGSVGGGLGGAGDGGEVLEEGHKIMPLYKSLIYI